MVQIGGGFASLHLLNDGVDRRLLQRLIAAGSVDHHFDFPIAFAALARSATKLRAPVMLQCRRGGGDWLDPSRPAGAQLIASRQLSSQHLFILRNRKSII
jgi:hypothetical protein